MNLQEAIEHCREKSEDKTINIMCRLQHGQLGDWMEELRLYREQDKERRE